MYARSNADIGIPAPPPGAPPAPGPGGALTGPDQGAPAPTPDPAGPAGREQAAPVPSPPAPVGPAPAPAAAADPVVPHTRAAGTWVALAAVMVFLIAVLIFILQNLRSVRVSFLMVHWRIPMGIDLLFAAILGGLVVFAAGTLRILQLRRLARRRAAGEPAGAGRQGRH